MKVSIRPLKIEDAYTSVRWRNDREVFQFTGNTYDHEITIDSELKWLDRVSKNKNEYRCAIIADDTYIGNIYLTDITSTTATYHIFIGNKEYWGKGVAREASKLILDYAFNQLNLKEVRLEVRPQNTSALKLYKKLGFIPYDKDDKFISMKIDTDSFNLD